jgi:hypothetical protein
MDFVTVTDFNFAVDCAPNSFLATSALGSSAVHR